MKADYHSRRPKKLLFVVNVDWFLLSHRMPIIEEAARIGYEVHVACKYTKYREEIGKKGFYTHDLSLNRSSTSFLSELKLFNELKGIIKNVKPDIIHLVTIKPVLYGSIIAKLLSRRSQVVAAISGVGYVFTAEGFIARLKRLFIGNLLKLGLNRKGVRVIFQNTSDKHIFSSLKLVSDEQSVLIKGSGVEVNSGQLVIERASPTPVFAFMARLLRDKGIYEFIKAASELKSSQARFVVIGQVDDNPESIKQFELDHWVENSTIEYWGFSSNPIETIAKVDVLVLPSYREGLPKVLLEAATCSKAVITTDVPGCRDAILPNETGLLVPAKDYLALANAMSQLIEDERLRQDMGRKGRLFVEQNFDVKDVVAKHIKLYESLLSNN